MSLLPLGETDLAAAAGAVERDGGLGQPSSEAGSGDAPEAPGGDVPTSFELRRFCRRTKKRSESMRGKAEHCPQPLKKFYL